MRQREREREHYSYDHKPPSTFSLQWTCEQDTMTLNLKTEQRIKRKWKMKCKNWKERERELQTLSKYTAFLCIYKEKCTQFQSGRKAWNDNLSVSENNDTIFIFKMHCLVKWKHQHSLMKYKKINEHIVISKSSRLWYQIIKYQP